MFIKIDHFLGHKTHLNKFKRIEIIQCMLSDYTRIKENLRATKNVESSKISGN